MASDQLARVRKRSAELWKTMTAEQRRDYNNRRDEALAILTVARPLITRHEECREQEKAREDNTKRWWVWTLVVIAVLLSWLDFKSVALLVGFLPMLVLIGGPIEAYFIGRRRERLHEQLEEQRYRWIKLGASSHHFDGYFSVLRGLENDPEAGEDCELVWWAELNEELMERVTRSVE